MYIIFGFFVKTFVAAVRKPRYKILGLHIRWGISLQIGRWIDTDRCDRLIDTRFM